MASLNRIKGIVVIINTEDFKGQCSYSFYFVDSLPCWGLFIFSGPLMDAVESTLLSFLQQMDAKKPLRCHNNNNNNKKKKNNNNAYNNEQPLKTPRDYLLSAIMTLIRAKKKMKEPKTKN